MTPHPFIIQSTNPFRRCRTLILALVSTFLLGVGFLASAVDADTLTSPIDHPLAHTATVPNEVTVKFVDGTTDQQRRAIERASSTKAEALTGPNARLLRITGNRSVEATIVKLQTNPHVEHVAPNVKARISAFIPDDPGKDGMDGWEKLQWNFIGPTSVNAPQAWENLIRAGRPGGTKVKVAVLDTGVACGKRFRNFIPSPDFKPGLGTCLHGFDFIENNNHPFDRNGHGTHVAGTIAERTNNDLAVTGLAYGAKIPPVRVLDRRGEGDAATIARGIRFAVKRKVSVINLSLEFGSLVRASQIPDVISAIRFAVRRGVVVVAASGNEGAHTISFPARANGVISVGATTQHGCQSEFSSEGKGLDLMAPGGGPDSPDPKNPLCHPSNVQGMDIFQMTFTSSPRRFRLPSGFEGTSMSSPHVAAAAALVIASGVLGPHPSPKAVLAHLKRTAHPLGSTKRYGAGLLDAAAATAPL